MQQSRLVRFLHLLTLYRRSAFYTLIHARAIFRNGRRGAGLKMMRKYQCLKRYFAETKLTVASMLSRIIAA